MSNEYHFSADNGIIVGSAWSKTFELPENLSGKTVELILRKRWHETQLYRFVSPTNITIGTPGARTSITVSLSTSDTAGMTEQIVDYYLRVVGGAEHLTGTLPIRL